MNSHSDADDTVQQITRIFAQAAGAWTGCDWPTKFGSAHLNLDKLSSVQAMLMARATAGKEEDAWWEASHWLAHVEREALEAENEARLAVEASQALQWEIALTHARNACDIEVRYHTDLVWQTLHDAISARVSGAAATGLRRVGANAIIDGDQLSQRQASP
jgi:hypothetical protein